MDWNWPRMVCRDIADSTFTSPKEKRKRGKVPSKLPAPPCRARATDPAERNQLRFSDRVEQFVGRVAPTPRNIGQVRQSSNRFSHVLKIRPRQHSSVRRASAFGAGLPPPPKRPTAGLLFAFPSRPEPSRDRDEFPQVEEDHSAKNPGPHGTRLTSIIGLILPVVNATVLIPSSSVLRPCHPSDSLLARRRDRTDAKPDRTDVGRGERTQTPFPCSLTRPNGTHCRTARATVVPSLRRRDILSAERQDDIRLPVSPRIFTGSR